MAHPFTVTYDPELTEEERQALMAEDDLLSSAFQRSHHWTVVKDSMGRRYLRAMGVNVNESPALRAVVS